MIQTNSLQGAKSIVSPAPLKTNQTTPVSKYNDEKVNQCVNAYQSEQKKYNSKISSGYIVVGFPSDTSLVSAKEIIKPSVYNNFIKFKKMKRKIS